MKSITIKNTDTSISISSNDKCILVNDPNLANLKDVKIVDAKLKAIANLSNGNQNFSVNFFANESCKWTNIEFLKDVKDSDSLIIDVSDELQTIIEKKLTAFEINFEGDSISFSDCELHIDYISLSEYQKNGSKHNIDLGTNGNASVDLATGQLSIKTPIVKSDEKPLPLSLSLNYNSINNEKIPEIGLPKNWHLNLHQFLIKSVNEKKNLEFTYIDQNGKSQIIEEKYYYYEGDKKISVSRKDLDVDLNGKLIFKIESEEFKEDDKTSVSDTKVLNSFKSIIVENYQIKYTKSDSKLRVSSFCDLLTQITNYKNLSIILYGENYKKEYKCLEFNKDEKTNKYLDTSGNQMVASYITYSVFNYEFKFSSVDNEIITLNINYVPNFENQALVYMSGFGNHEVPCNYYTINSNLSNINNSLVDIDIIKNTKAIVKEIFTELESTEGIKLITSINDLKTSRLVNFEPEELAQTREQINQLEDAFKEYTSATKQNEKQFCLYALTKKMIEKQLKVQEPSIASKKAFLDLNDKIETLRDIIVRSSRDDQTKNTLNSDPFTISLIDQLYDSRSELSANQKKIVNDLLDESSTIYSLGIGTVDGSLSQELNMNTMNDEIYCDEITKEAFTQYINEILSSFPEKSIDIDCDDIWGDFRYTLANGTKLSLGYKDLISIDIQLETALENLEKYSKKAKEYKNQLAKLNHQKEIYEMQVPVHYIYNDENVALGFAKTTNENVFRLVYITDSYDNKIYIQYESIDSNKIEKIINSSENSIKLEYCEKFGYIKNITDTFNQKIFFEYDDQTGSLTKIIKESGDLAIFYLDDKIDYLLDHSGLGCKFSYTDDKVCTIEGISTLESIEHEKPLFKIQSETINDYILPDKKITLSYNNYKSTSVENANGKKITYLFDKYGRISCLYENNFDGTFSCEDDSIINSNFNEFNYQDNKLILKTSILPNANDFFDNSQYENNSVVAACEQEISSLQENLYLGEDLLCGDSSVPSSYTVYHNHYKFADETSKAKISLDTATLCDIINEKCHRLLVLSCWAKGDSAFVIDNEESSSSLSERKFEIRAEIKYFGKDLICISKTFDWRNTNWQYCALPIMFDSLEIESFECYIDYSNNTNIESFEFTKLQLTIGDYEKTDFDNNGLVIKKENGHSEWCVKYQYDDNQNLINEIIERKEPKENIRNIFETKYIYNQAGHVVKTIDFNDIVKENVYDKKGCIIKTLTYHKNEPCNILYEEKLLNDTGEKIGELNELGNKIFDYKYKEESNLISYKIDKKGNIVVIARNLNNNLLQATSTIDGTENANTFGYTLDFLTSLKHNGFEINYNYDGQGKTKEIQIAGLTYLSKEYPSLNEKVVKYGNNVTYRYISDEDKLLQVYYKEKDTPELLILQNIYDIYGNLIYTEDKINKETHKFFVDEFGKTNRKELSQHGISVEIQDVYDQNHSKVNNSTIRFSSTPSSTMNYEYKYNNSPNPKLESISLSIDTENNANQVFEEIVNYDKLGRPSTIVNNSFKKEISYLRNGDHTSTLVSKLNFANDDIINDQLAYKYDEKGNIVEIRKNNQLLVNYYYDSISRLIREDNKEFNKTNIFVYDGGGNIIERKEFDFTIATNLENEKCKTYKFHYPINGWRDQLKFYSYEEISTENGSEIISTVKRKFDYDMLGNPEIYKGYNLKWTHGRQLEAFDFVENNEAYKARAKYKYNHEGIRIQKILDENIIKCQCENCSCENCNPYKIDFYLDGSKILKQKDSCNELTFYYGIDGITGFHIKSSNAMYKNEPLDHDFFYKKNAQNDIISIYSSTGDMICEYIYDAWGNQKIKYANSSGKLVAIEDTFEYNDTSEINRFIAFKNPFRYRSYYYDFETNLYYLNSRYYDPEIGRFISADDISYLDKENLNGLNLYVYCGNNPVMNFDPSGKSLLAIFIILIVLTIAGAVTNGIIAYNNGARGWDLVGQIFIGAMIGLAAGGLIIASGAGIAGAFGAATFLGVGVLQAFAIGALAYNFVAFVVAPILGWSMPGIEYETPKQPDIPNNNSKSSKYSLIDSDLQQKYNISSYNINSNLYRSESNDRILWGNIN